MRKLRFLLYLLVSLVAFAAITGCCVNIVMPWFTGKGRIVQVPDLKGMDIEDAKRELRSLGLDLRTDTALPSREYAEGVVMGQRPDPGARVKPGRRVMVTVSLGQKTVEVPDLEGQEGEHARAELRKLGLYVRMVNLESTDMEAGLVIGTRPGTGAQVTLGDTITLIVSAGLPQIIPDTVLSEIESLESSVTDTSKNKPR